MKIIYSITIISLMILSSCGNSQDISEGIVKVEKQNVPIGAEEIENINKNFNEINIQDFGTENGSLDNDMTDIYTAKNSGETILMIPGLGLSHSIYVNTPDNRTSWGEYFYDKGFDVAIMNPVSNVGSEIDGKKQWSASAIWRRWGFGDSLDSPYENTKYPVGDIQGFYDNLPFYGGGGGGRGTSSDNRDIEALDTFINTQSQPVYIIFHSAAGNLVFDYAKENPENIAGLIAIEPVGCPTDEQNIPNIRFLSIYGDFIESRNQVGRYEACKNIADILGDRGTMVYLPEMGIEGNSHIMMQDTNNIDIAKIISDWIEIQ